MSKTVATCIAETNQEQNKPQENVFFLTLSRKIEDFPNEFLRTARSTSPIQICAIFSTIGPDNLSAELNLELNAELEKIVASTANQPVLDFEAFSNLVVNTLNVRVLNFGINKGKQFKTSMTMLVIEGDILRVIHLGITKAVLFRDKKIMVLTEEQTVAHRYVQMGSITPEEEKDNPENMNLTQYLGKLPQDGELKPEKKVHLKLRDDDEIILMGLGISRGMPAQMRNSIIVRPDSTENKAKEIINAAVNNGVKSGLTIIDLKVESTFLLPGDAVIRTNLQSDASIAPVAAATVAAEKSDFTPFELAEKDEDADDTISFVPGKTPIHVDEDEEEEEEEAEEVPDKASVGRKIATIVMPIIVFILCLILGFGIMFLVLNIRDFMEANAPETMPSAAVGTAYYAVEDNTPVYSMPSQNSTIIANLKRGDVVTLQQAVDQNFSKVVTSNSMTGYCLTSQLTTEDPNNGAAPSESAASESAADATQTEGGDAQVNPNPEATTTTTETEAEEEDPTPTPTPKPKKATSTPTPKPVETEPADPEVVETEPDVTSPVVTKPAETKPAETKPAETKPAETKPAETKPAEEKPAEDKTQE